MSDVVLALINFLTSAMTAITGLGGGMILIGLMPLFLPASVIVPIHGATQLASNASRAFFGHKNLDWKYVPSYLIGSCMGVVVFGLLVTWVALDVIPLFIAIYILLTQWSKSFNHLLKSLENFYLIGFLQTGIGLFVGATGPLHMPLLLKKYSDNHTVVTTGSLMISVVHLCKLVVYGLLGFAFLEYWQIIVMMIVCAVIGSWVGVRVRHKLPMPWLRTALPWLLTIIALKIIVDYTLALSGI